MPGARATTIAPYYGGKARIASWIVSHLPPHKTYVEPFCGVASVLMKKRRSDLEVINDIDDNIHNMFCVLRDDSLWPKLMDSLDLTPWSRKEWEDSLPPYPEGMDSVERARRTLVQLHMSFGGVLRNGAFKIKTKNGPLAWSSASERIPPAVERLRGVVVERGDAMKVIERYDSKDALFYVDPPYVGGTRPTNKNGYLHEMAGEGDHVRLLEALNEIDGSVVLSGYESDVYKDMLKEWKTYKKATTTNRHGSVTECLWVRASKGRAEKKTTLPF